MQRSESKIVVNNDKDSDLELLSPGRLRCKVRIAGVVEGGGGARTRI